MKKLLLLLILLNAFSITRAAENILLINVDGAISPGTADYIHSGINEAAAKNAEALIIKLNTPGGLLESTRDIVSDIMSSKVPIIVYVAPGGARAGSAGVFITLAANVAVMAPGTNIGAAHPVGAQGESGDSNDVMWSKVTNDAAAFIRSIAQKRQRNIVWAERAVRESISATENEALRDSVINFICPDIDSLKRAIEGMIVETVSGKHKLQTANANIITMEMNWRAELLSIISDPNIAYILMMIGIYGLLFEIFNPGSVFPGVVGGISLILAFYSLQMLPINYAGLALIILAIILFLLEIKVTSYGILSIGGVIALFFGSLMLIDSPMEFMDISMSLIIVTTVLTVLFFSFVITLGLRAQKRKKTAGAEGMTGMEGIVINEISAGKPGRIKVHGEIWRAVADMDIAIGETVEIIEVKDLTLIVKPKP